MTVGLIHTTGHSERPSVKRTSLVRTYSSMLHVISLVNNSNHTNTKNLELIIKSEE